MKYYNDEELTREILETIFNPLPTPGYENIVLRAAVTKLKGMMLSDWEPRIEIFKMGTQFADDTIYSTALITPYINYYLIIPGNQDTIRMKLKTIKESL